MRPRLTQLSLAVIMESANIILVYCPPLRGLIPVLRQCSYRSLSIAPPLRGLIFHLGYFFHTVILLPPSRGLILHAASGQLLNGGAPSTLFHPPSTPPLCVPLPTFHSGEAASAIRKQLQKNIFDLTVALPRKDDTIYMNKEILLHYA